MSLQIREERPGISYLRCSLPMLRDDSAGAMIDALQMIVDLL